MEEPIKQKDTKGQIQPGEVRNPDGRPKGSKNKYTKIKEMICDIVSEREEELKTLDLKHLVSFVSSTAPKETKIEVDKPIVVKWEGEK